MTFLYVAESAAGFGDSDVIALALRENRILLHRDKVSASIIFSGDVRSPALC